MPRGPITQKQILILLFFTAFLALHFYLKMNSETLTPKTPPVKDASKLDFEAKALDGRTFNLRATTQTQNLTILNFWETWCAPCVKELPDLQRIYEENKSKGVEILAVFNNSNMESVHSMVKELGLTFPILHDHDGSISRMFQIRAVPTTFVLNPKQEVIRYHSGLDQGLRAFVRSRFEIKKGS